MRPRSRLAVGSASKVEIVRVGDYDQHGAMGIVAAFERRQWWL